ncbi:hypothetical protein DSO57_1005088 [Entomophthora muscae]|uniref:Uncharacterized protein n=1 Tax=Entomophthora muscae TaxID=34485 RepID=A0ACC2RMT7_9FUNG|nr:hypothetical protein DSO57_1005088 [Entomophthora muscae]
MKPFSILTLVPSLALQVASSPVVSSGFESDEVMEAQFQKANHYPTTEHALKRRHYYDASSYVRSHERIPRFPNIFKTLFSFIGKGIKYAATGIKKVANLGIDAVKKDPSLLTKAVETIVGLVSSPEKESEPVERMSTGFTRPSSSDDARNSYEPAEHHEHERHSPRHYVRGDYSLFENY